MRQRSNPVIGAVASALLIAAISISAQAAPKDTAPAKATINSPVPNGGPFGPGNRRAANISGLAVTGINRIRDEVAVELPYVADLSFSLVGVQDTANPDGPALPVTADTPDEAILATYADPEFYETFYGITDTSTIPGQNLPYSQVPHIINELGESAEIPQQAANEAWWEVNNGAENADYTLGQWLAASGNLHFFCNPAKGNHFSLRVRGLIPGGLYSLWGYYYDQQTGALEAPFPFGGTSNNVFTVERTGRLRTDHNMAFCPQDVDPANDQQMVFIMLTYHPDGQIHGGTDAVLGDPVAAGPGINAIPHVMFPFPLSP